MKTEKAEFREFLQLLELLDRGFLRNEEQAKTAFTLIADGKIDDEKIKEFLLKINKIGINSTLLCAAAQVFSRRAIKLNAPENTIDVCGAGGDGLNTLNISSAVAFVVAACGIAIAKHGNRSASSAVGSADVFEALDIDINQSKERIEESLFTNNIAFIFAPNYHPALRNIAPLRRELKVRTIFNFLGPLLNPAQLSSQLVGCSDEKIAPIMLDALNLLGRKRAAIVYGLDGMDEISISTDSIILKMDEKIIYPAQIFNPQNYGIKKVNLNEIKGGDVHYNARKIVDLLRGEKSAFLDIVAINSALALILAKKTDDFKEAILLAGEAIDSGRAFDILQKLRKPNL